MRAPSWLTLDTNPGGDGEVRPRQRATNTTREHQGLQEGRSPPACSPRVRYGDETVVLSPLAFTVKVPHGFDV